MIKHSASHGCATLVCTAAAGIIVYLLHRFVPDLLEVTTPVAAPLAALLGGIPFFTLENVQSRSSGRSAEPGRGRPVSRPVSP